MSCWKRRCPRLAKKLLRWCEDQRITPDVKHAVDIVTWLKTHGGAYKWKTETDKDFKRCYGYFRSWLTDTAQMIPMKWLREFKSLRSDEPVVKSWIKAEFARRRFEAEEQDESEKASAAKKYA